MSAVTTWLIFVIQTVFCLLVVPTRLVEGERKELFDPLSFCPPIDTFIEQPRIVSKEKQSSMVYRIEIIFEKKTVLRSCRDFCRVFVKIHAKFNNNLWLFWGILFIFTQSCYFQSFSASI